MHLLRVPTFLENSWKLDPPGKLLENSWKFDPPGNSSLIFEGPGKTPGILGLLRRIVY